MLLGVGDGVFTAPNIPFAPGRDYREIRRECGIGQLEADLVVPLPGAAVRERVGADSARDLDCTAAMRYAPSMCRQILAAVDRPGPHVAQTKSRRTPDAGPH